MKKLLLIPLLLLAASSAWGADECSLADGWPKRATLHGAGTTVIETRVDCVAAADGSYTAFTIPQAGGFLLGMLFCPDDTTAPTNAMDVTVEFGDTGFDLLNNGTDLSNSACSYREALDDSGNKRLMPFATAPVLKPINNSADGGAFSAYFFQVP